MNPAFPPRTVTWDKHHDVIAFSDREKGQAVFCGVYLVEREVLISVREGDACVSQGYVSRIREAYRHSVFNWEREKGRTLCIVDVCDNSARALGGGDERLAYGKLRAKVVLKGAMTLDMLSLKIGEDERIKCQANVTIL